MKVYVSENLVLEDRAKKAVEISRELIKKDVKLSVYIDKMSSIHVFPIVIFSTGITPDNSILSVFCSNPNRK